MMLITKRSMAAAVARIFGVASGELDPGLRARAKVVNFGIMYGMGARSLSQQMGIGLEEAQDFIRNYFSVFARVRDYLDNTLDDARRRLAEAEKIGPTQAIAESAITVA